MTINIVAVGFNGANGETGFAGTPGGRGGDGYDADCGFWDDDEPSRGGGGSRGSDGGFGTGGANGGAGGSIRIEVTEYRGGIEADCRGGTGGRGGDGGAGGIGGPGGDGGWGSDCEANAYGGRDVIEDRWAQLGELVAPGWPADPFRLRAIGELLFASHEFDGALYVFQRASKLAPEAQDAARFARMPRRFGEATPSFEDVIAAVERAASGVGRTALVSGDALPA